MENHLRAWREARRLTQDALGAAAGTDKTVISKLERSKRRLTTLWLARLAPALKATPTALLGPPPAPGAAASESVKPAQPPLGAETWARDLPVRGSAAAAIVGAFQLADETIDYVRRPPPLAGIADAYAIYVEGDSMSPRWEHGELAIVHPGRPARPGDYVIVQTQTHEAAGVEAYIKRLVKHDDNWVVLAQFNPPATIKVKASLVRAIHRVLRPEEILSA